MIKYPALLLFGGLLVPAVPALAADLPRGVIAAPMPAAAPMSSVALEFSPEFAAVTTGSTSAGTFIDGYVKGYLSHTFAPGWTGSVTFQDILRTNGLSEQLYEANLAYRATVNDNLSFTGTGYLGLAAGNTNFLNGSPIVGPPSNNEDNVLYYALAGAADWKIDTHWTWNAIYARWRNGFDRTFIEPKVSTGFTYAIDPKSSVYGNIGYLWTDNGNGQGIHPEKYDVAVGYRYSF